MPKTVMTVDYNEHIRKGDEAPKALADKLVKVGLAKRVGVRKTAPKKPKSQAKTED